MTTRGSNLGGAVLRLTADASPLDRSVAQAEADTTKRLENLSGRTRALGTSFAVAGGAVTAAFGLAVKTAAEFEQSMAQVRAVSGATSEEFEALTNIALEMGQTTVFTARQSADALSFMAMAGLNAHDSIEALPDVLNLAAAGQLELAQASDIVTNVMAGYGIEASEVTKATDVLTTGFTSANTDLVQLGQAFKYAGPVAKSAGLSFEETSAALSLMGNAGLQASVAGTGLRGSVTRLLNPSNEARDVLDRLGVTATDSAGNLLPLRDIISQFEDVGLSAGDAMTIFGQRAGPSMLALIEQGSGALAELQTEMEQSGGTAQRIADTQLDTLSGSMTLLSSATEGLQQSIGQILAPTVRRTAEILTGVIQRVQEWTQAHPGLTKAVVILVAALGVGAGLAGVLALGLSGILALSGSFALMGGAVVALTAKVVALGAALGVSTGGLTIIIGALVTGLGVLAHHFFTSGDEAEKLATDQLPPLAAALYELREATGETSEAIDSLLSEALAQLEERAGPAASAVERFRNEFRQLNAAERAAEIQGLEAEVELLNQAFLDTPDWLDDGGARAAALGELNDATRRLTVAQEEHAALNEQLTSDAYKLAVEELAKAQRELTREQEAGTLVGASLEARQEELNRLRSISVQLADSLGISEAELDSTLDQLTTTTASLAEVSGESADVAQQQVASMDELAASVETLTGRTVELTEDSGADLVTLMTEMERSFGVVIPLTGDLTTDMQNLSGAIEDVNQSIFSQQLAWDNLQASVEQAQEAYKSGDGARAQELLAEDAAAAEEAAEAIDRVTDAQERHKRAVERLYDDDNPDDYWAALEAGAAHAEQQADAAKEAAEGALVLADAERELEITLIQTSDSLTEVEKKQRLLQIATQDLAVVQQTYDQVMASGSSTARERTAATSALSDALARQEQAENALAAAIRSRPTAPSLNAELAEANADFALDNARSQDAFQLKDAQAREQFRLRQRQAEETHQRKLAQARQQYQARDAQAREEFRQRQRQAEAAHVQKLEQERQQHNAKLANMARKYESDRESRRQDFLRDRANDETKFAFEQERNAVRHQQSLSSLEAGYQRRREDARSDHYEKLADIRRDAIQRERDAELDRTRSQEDIERDYQRGVEELQRRLGEQFFDTPDADITGMLSQVGADTELLEAHLEGMADLARERDQALEDTEIHHSRKLEDIAINRARKQQEAQQAHDSKMLEMDLQHKEKLLLAESDYRIRRREAELLFRMEQDLADEEYRLLEAEKEAEYRMQVRATEDAYLLARQQAIANFQIRQKAAEDKFLLGRQQAADKFRESQRLAQEEHDAKQRAAREKFLLDREQAAEKFRQDQRLAQENHDAKLAEIRNKHQEVETTNQSAHNEALEDQNRTHQENVALEEEQAHNQREIELDGFQERLAFLEKDYQAEREALVADHQQRLYNLYEHWTSLIANKMRALLSEAIDIVERLRDLLEQAQDMMAAAFAGGGGVTAMAEGGIAKKPTFALIGEEEPEVVIPLSKLSTIIPEGFGRAAIRATEVNLMPTVTAEMAQSAAPMSDVPMPDFSQLKHRDGEKPHFTVVLSGDLDKLGNFIGAEVLDGDLRGRQEVFNT